MGHIRPIFFLLLAYLTLFVSGMADNARGPLLPDMIRDLGLHDREASLFFALAALSSMPGSLAIGHLLRRRGSLVALRVAVGCFVLGFWCIAAASGYPMVLVGAALYGFGLGGCHIVTNVMAAQATTPAQRTRHMSRLQVMYGVASLCAPLVVVGLRAMLHRWQHIFLALTILPTLLVAGSCLVANQHPVPAPAAVRRSMWRLLRDPTCRFYAALMGTYVAAELCVVLWLVVYVTRTGQADATTAAMLLSGFFLCMTLARVVGGWVLSGKNNSVVLMASAAGGMLCVGLGIHVHPVFLSLSAFPLGFFFPVGFASASHELADHLETAIGWVFSAVFVAIFLSQIVMGWLSDLTSIMAAMHLPVVLLGAVIVMLLVRPPAAVGEEEPVTLPAGL